MIVIENCAIATVDGAGSEHAAGHLVVEDERIVAVGAGPAPAGSPGASGVRRIDGDGCLGTPGLVNCHHHLFQWITRGLAQQANLFDWQTALYPLWSRLAPEIEAAASLGIRFHPARGSMDLSRSRGGLPPDEIVEDRDTALAATEAAISSDARLGAGIAPVAALVLGPPAPVELLLVGGRVVVEGGELRTGSGRDIARQARAASRRLLDLAGVTA